MIYILFKKILFQIKHVLTYQCATAGLMFVFKTIMPLLAASDFFIGSKKKMDLSWACMRLIYVVSALELNNEEDNSIMLAKKVLDLCLPHSPTSIASLMILNIASIGNIFI